MSHLRKKDKETKRQWIYDRSDAEAQTGWHKKAKALQNLNMSKWVTQMHSHICTHLDRKHRGTLTGIKVPTNDAKRSKLPESDTRAWDQVIDPTKIE